MDHTDHVLIVDHDRDIRELVSGYLKRNGLRVTLAADGRQMRSRSSDRDSGGTGLGLAIGGSLTLRNRQAGGLCAEVPLG